MFDENQMQTRFLKIGNNMKITEIKNKNIIQKNNRSGVRT